MKNYVLIDEDGLPISWTVANCVRVLTFNNISSAYRFRNALRTISLFDYHGYIYPEEYDYMGSGSTLNVTNLIPVQNGDDVELKEVD